MSWLYVFTSASVAFSAIRLGYVGEKWMALWLAWCSGWAAGLGFGAWCARRRYAAMFDMGDKKGDFTTVTVVEGPEIKTGDAVMFDSKTGHGVKIVNIAKDLKDKKESV